MVVKWFGCLVIDVCVVVIEWLDLLVEMSGDLYLML